MPESYATCQISRKREGWIGQSQRLHIPLMPIVLINCLQKTFSTHCHLLIRTAELRKSCYCCYVGIARGPGRAGVPRSAWPWQSHWSHLDRSQKTSACRSWFDHLGRAVGSSSGLLCCAARRMMEDVGASRNCRLRQALKALPSPQKIPSSEMLMVRGLHVSINSLAWTFPFKASMSLIEDIEN